MQTPDYLWKVRDCICREVSAGRAACVAYSDSFGEAGSMGTTGYYLASAFGKVDLTAFTMQLVTQRMQQGGFCEYIPLASRSWCSQQAWSASQALPHRGPLFGNCWTSACHALAVQQPLALAEFRTQHSPKDIVHCCSGLIAKEHVSASVRDLADGTSRASSWHGRSTSQQWSS